MKNVQLLMAFVLTLTLGGMTSKCASFKPRQTAETSLEVEDVHERNAALRGDDLQYAHGKWCFDDDVNEAHSDNEDTKAAWTNAAYKHGAWCVDSETF